MKGRPGHGIISIAALDLRRSPDHRSELCSQLLLGEVVRVVSGSRDGRWWRVRSTGDGDHGWVRGWGFQAVGARGTAVWRRRARARVVACCTELRAEPGRGALVSPLFLNSRIAAGPRRGRHRRAVLPDGRAGWVEASALSGIGRRGIGLEARVASLLGVPYLWGGRTPLGMDCSAFSQIVLAEIGIALPRDAAEQYRLCRPLPDGEQPRAGDLAFFGPRRGPPAHVGVVLGGGLFAHARGHVRVGSLDGYNVLYDNALGRQFRGVRRAPEGPVSTPPGGGRSRRIGLTRFLRLT